MTHITLKQVVYVTYKLLPSKLHDVLQAIDKIDDIADPIDIEVEITDMTRTRPEVTSINEPKTNMRVVIPVEYSGSHNNSSLLEKFLEKKETRAAFQTFCDDILF